jgi:serpin B
MKKKNRVIVTASICLTILGLAGVWCAKQPASFAASDARARPSPQISNQVANEKLVTANTKLTFKLFSEILKKQHSENIFISPASLAIALNIVYNGAGGETQEAIAKTLELQGTNLQEINQANADLKASLKNPDPQSSALYCQLPLDEGKYTLQARISTDHPKLLPSRSQKSEL